MDANQPLLPAVDTGALEISCDQNEGQNDAYWNDIIDDVVPGAQDVKRLKDSGPNGSASSDAISSSAMPSEASVISNGTNGPTGTIINDRGLQLAEVGRFADSNRPGIEANVIEDLQVAMPAVDSHIDGSGMSNTHTNGSSSRLAHTNENSKALLSLEPVIQHSQTPVSAFEQRLIATFTHDVQTQVFASTDIHGWIVRAIQHGLVDQSNKHLIACLKDLKDEITKSNELESRNKELEADIKDEISKSNELASKNKELEANVEDLTLKNMELTNNMAMLQEAFKVNQEETKQLRSQALVLLQNRVRALMAQTYELHDSSVPRLFVALPHDTWNPTNLFSNKFRLYFLCECDEHTKSADPRTPHHIHFAKHEGYEISRPTELFGQYGHHILTTVKMLKFEVSVAGVSIPPVSRQDTKCLGMSSRDLQDRMDQVIGYLEKVIADKNSLASVALRKIEDKEKLKSEDLRKLPTFLEIKDTNKAWGNLYKTATLEAHAKWVCIDHYREVYDERTTKTLRDTAELMGGSFDENNGRVAVHLRSKTQAEQFYQALEGSKSMHELHIALDWDTTLSDFKKLRDTLRTTSIGTVRVDLQHQGCPASDILNRNRRYDPIFGIMQHPSIRSFSIIRAPADFIKQSSLQSRNDNFSNLRHLGIDLSALKKDILGIKMLVSRTTNLTMLALDDAKDWIVQVYNAIVEYQTYPITFDDLVRISPPTRGSYQPTASARSVKEMFRDHRGRIEVLEPDRRLGAGPIAHVFDTLIGEVPGLMELSVLDTDLIGEATIKKLAAIVAWSEVSKLEVHLRFKERRERILGSIPWKHMCHLHISMDDERVGTRALKVLVEGIHNMSGQLELEWFMFRSHSFETITDKQAELLRKFLASISVRTLTLSVDMFPATMVSVLKAADLSRVERLVLCSRGYSYGQLDSVLDCLGNAQRLQRVKFYPFLPNQEQKDRMKARGVTL
ncbi:hypothetical protein B0O80DRAFT_258724 [Mortierella sp. GBAus27b]|nr:hypothetical protein BGX31_011577 [Mortierella sp. GBA43]KAI8358924.1 hypothetical protein B0O80DRAFT_258724 [Mortierella sp. GBAus27b]